jgi:hypothetical protein
MGGIDCGYLTRQRVARGCVRSPVLPRGAHDAHARAKDDDTGEEEQRFSFRGRWHGDKFASPITNCIICLF